jgi:DNA invertase Pin-like site-specific DNA recombinase
MKAALYSRTSLNNRVQVHEAQLAPLREYCNYNGLEIFAEYCDNAPGSEEATRPGWDRMMSDAKLENFNVALMTVPDRSTRSKPRFTADIQALKDCGVSVIFKREIKAL